MASHGIDAGQESLARRMQAALVDGHDGAPFMASAATEYLCTRAKLSLTDANAFFRQLVDAGAVEAVDGETDGAGPAPVPSFGASGVRYVFKLDSVAVIVNPLMFAGSVRDRRVSTPAESAGGMEETLTLTSRRTYGAFGHERRGAPIFRSFRGKIPGPGLRSASPSSSPGVTPPGSPGPTAAAADAFARDEAKEYALHVDPAPIMRDGERFEGFLEKRGNTMFADWRRRWAVLSGSLLAYFEDEQQRTALGVVDLAVPGVALRWGRDVNARHRRRLTFDVQTTRRAYSFQAADVEDLREWLARLRSQIAAAQRAAVSMQMRVCRDLCAALARENLLHMASSDSALTVSAKKTAGKRRKQGPAARYELGEELGSGNFGRVRLAVERASGREFALKVIPRPRADDERSHRVLRGEIEALERMMLHGGHANVIALHEVIESEDTIYLVLELASGGQLMDAIVARSSFDENDARGYARQVVRAVAFMHSIRIVHRDLKPENVQLAADGSVKLLDFGFAALLPPRDDGLATDPEHAPRLAGAARLPGHAAAPAPPAPASAPAPAPDTGVAKRIEKLRRLRGKQAHTAQAPAPAPAPAPGPTRNGTPAPGANGAASAGGAGADGVQKAPDAPPLPYDERLE